MHETQNGVATLPDVTAETFVRFVEYLYTGDYTAAEHVAVLEGDFNRVEAHMSQSKPLEEVKTAPTMPPRFLQRPTRIGSRQKFYWDLLEQKTFDHEEPSRSPPARPNTDCCEHYTDVFLSHAQIYVFADKYDVKALRDLSLHKLHTILRLFTLFENRTSDIATLVRYIYDHTPEREVLMDDLRSLVMEYVCCEIEALLPNPHLRLSLKSEGSASLDLLDKLMA